MLNAISEISWIGVLLVTVRNFIFGGIYFGVVIAKMYARAMGRANQPTQKPSFLMIAGPAVCGFFITVTSALFISILKPRSLHEALVFVAIIGFGYLIPMTMTIAINPNFPRPFFYTAINAPYFLLTSIVTSVILVFMK